MSGVVTRIAGIAIRDGALAVHARLRSVQRTGETQIVVGDIRDESLLVFAVPGANAGEAFRRPFRYAQ
jgi:hypothetical protein